MILNDRSQFNEDNNFRKDIRKETCDEVVIGFNYQGSSINRVQSSSPIKNSLLIKIGNN